MYPRESRIMRKLLGTKPAPDTPGDPVSNAAPTSSPATYRPSKAQNAVYAAGVPISCLDVSPDKRSVALAGPHILKTIVLDDPTSFDFDFSDGADVRAAITAQPSTIKTAAPDQLNIRDVKWHSNSMIFTACANGRIFAYDISRIGAGHSEPMEHIHIQEDSRQVNTLDVNPHLKSWLLSGSQDGLARVFDTANAIHTRSGFLTFRQRFAGLRCNDSIRQVKWSPRVGHEMACCTDSGVVWKWDVRQPSRPLLRIPAHEKSCTGISWHPDGVHLMSSGSDCKLHVWDMGTSADRRQKPKWSISTPAPVKTLAWRPGLWSATTQSRRVAQVAVTYDENSKRRFGTSVIHIWDLARPTMPYKEIERFDSSPSALSWQDQDMLWSVGHDGLFCQNDVAHAPRLIDRKSTSAMAFSSKGDVLMLLDERPQKPRPRPSVLNQSDAIPRTSYDSSPRQMLSVSRSDSEEDVLGSFVSPRQKIHKRALANSTAAASMSTTPPGASILEDSKQVMGLEQAMKATGLFKTQQAMASGHVPAAQSVQTYKYLTTVYLEVLEKHLPFIPGGKSLAERVAHILEQYARAAERISLFRLSQTWRILAFAFGLLLSQRAQYHRRVRLAWHETQKLTGGSSSSRGLERHVTAPVLSSSQSTSTGNQLLAPSQSSEDIYSTSNVPTPIVRPADRYQYGRKLTPVAEPESFSIGPASQGPFHSGSPRKRLDSAPISFMSEDSEASRTSHTEGYDFYDTETLAHAIDVPYSKSEHNRIRSGDRAGDDTAEPRQEISRHDSGDSYSQMFSTSDVMKSTASGSPRVTRPQLVAQTSMMSTESNGEYGSRIRGEVLRKSSPDKSWSSKPPTRRRHTITDSPDDVFMISQTTMTSDDIYPYPSQSSIPSVDSENQRHGDVDEVDKPVPPTTITTSGTASKPPETPKPSQTSFYDSTPDIVETDYLPWADDIPYPFARPNDNKTVDSFKGASTPPLDPYTLVTRALEFESRTSALNASAIVLLLKPLLPDSVIDFHRASAILRQHHSRLMKMGLFVEAALLRNLCVAGWPEGIPHWGENYTAVFSPAQQQNTKVALSCSSCHKPREIDPRGDRDITVWTCERCRQVQAPCAVCGHRDPQIASCDPTGRDGDSRSDDTYLGAPSLSGWWYCPGCTHGGHASCLQLWHQPSSSSAFFPFSYESSKYSGGCCPLDGCGHACIPGKYRGEMTTARADELGRAAVEQTRSGRTSRAASPQRGGVSSGVRSDGNDIPQSRAVGVARETLNKGGGILSSSPGRNTGERERRKSVKFAGTSH